MINKWPNRIMRKIDQLDRELLKLLKHNARASITELATALGLTRTTIKSRIEALENDGIIHRFTLDVADAADEKLINAVSLIEIDLAKVDKVHRALKRVPELTSLHTTNGKWVLVVRSETPNLAAFDRLLRKLGNTDGFLNVETCLLLTRLI